MHLSIDGKAIKSARDKVNDGNTLYIVSAFLSDIGLSVGQLKVDDKSNEITAILELIKLIDIKVKDNQKDLKDNLKIYYDLGLKEDSLDIAIGETN